MMRLAIFLAFTLSLLAVDSTAGAPVSATVPPCALWTRADAAFYGKVVRVEKPSKDEEVPAGTQKIRFQVLENFKGADNPTFTLFETGDAKMKKGENWIVYARTDIVVKSFTILSGAKVEAKETSAELETLRAIAGGKSSSSIAGRLVTDAAGGKYSGEPVEVSVEGGGRSYAAKTDADGAFMIVVPDGSYRVALKFPWRAHLKWDENLLGASLAEGPPTLFKYDVRLNDGDCHFGVFEVTKANN